MRCLFRTILHFLYKPVLEKYLAKDRTWCFDGLRLQVRKGVFHPAFFGSTRVFAAFLKTQELKGRTVLEVGCGSGLLAIQAARQGAEVVALDLNPAAVENTRINAVNHQLTIQVLASDVFEQLPVRSFDRIFTNPPYFPGQAQNDAGLAWYCGLEFDFFHGFFAGLENYTHSKSRIWMILSEVCDLNRLQTIAGKYGWTLKKIHEADRLFETFVVLESVRG